MASSLFPQSNQGSSILSAIQTARSIAGGDPQAALRSMYQNNPEFRQFADSMRGKTPEQAFRENGLDYRSVMGLMR